MYYLPDRINHLYVNYIFMYNQFYINFNFFGLLQTRNIEPDLKYKHVMYIIKICTYVYVLIWIWESINPVTE